MAAPAVPNFISYPSTITKGETFTISWGMSSGGNFMNPLKYRLEGKYDNGSWFLIEETTGITTVYLVSGDMLNVTFRVYAIVGTEASAYQTGPTVVLPVPVNMAPKTPTIQSMANNAGYFIHGKPTFYYIAQDPEYDLITEINIKIFTGASGTAFEQDIYATDFVIESQIARYTLKTALTTGIKRVQARLKDSNGKWSGWSDITIFRIQAAPWTDTIAPGSGFKAEWMNQLATVINAERQARNLMNLTFTDGTITNQTDIKKIHVTERRNGIISLLAFDKRVPTFSDTNLNVANNQVVVEMRNLLLRNN